jgi:hypothetical protein
MSSFNLQDKIEASGQVLEIASTPDQLKDNTFILQLAEQD